MTHDKTIQVTKRWIKDYSDRAGEEPFVLGYHTSIADLKSDDRTVHVKDVSQINPRGPGVGERPKKVKKRK